jgi:hypothetical protein
MSSGSRGDRDHALESRRLGGVCGNSYGVGIVGATVDIEAEVREQAESIVEERVKAWGIDRFGFDS